MTNTLTGAEVTPEAIGAVMGQLMGDFAASAGTFLGFLGARVGLWDAVAAGPGSAQVIAERAGLGAPYVREWLRSQAAAGYVHFDPRTGAFSVSPAVAAVFGSGALSGLPVGLASQFRVYWTELERYEEAFRSGRGIAWGELPAGHSDGMDLITRAVVAPVLVGEWLPALDGVVARLERGAVVADVCCGYGSPTIAMAEAFPASRFFGFDVDDASIGRARRAAEEAGMADRVSFEVAAATAVPGGPYDLVTIVDALHDLGDPVGALRRVRAVLADDGRLLAVDHAGSERLEENLNPVGRLFYAASALVCTPNALAEHGDPLGCIPGETALRRVAEAAGFSRVRRLDVGAPLNMLLEMWP